MSLVKKNPATEILCKERNITGTFYNNIDNNNFQNQSLDWCKYHGRLEDFTHHLLDCKLFQVISFLCHVIMPMETEVISWKLI